jgi:hypothetical protein
MPAAVPSTHTDLLDKPTFAHLATVRPDGAQYRFLEVRGDEQERAALRRQLDAAGR